MAGTTTGTATIKDVYEIVGKVDAKLDTISDQLAVQAQLFEHRLTARETEATAHGARLKETETAVEALKIAQAVTRGHTRVLMGLGSIIVTFGGAAIAHGFHW